MQSVIKSHTHPIRVASTPNKTKTNHTIDLIVYKHSTHITLCDSLALGLSGSSQTPKVTHFPFSFHLINPRNKNVKPCFVQLHQEPKGELIYQMIR